MLRKVDSGKKKASSELSGGCLVLFGFPFLASGLFVAWIYFSGLVDWWSARTWVETPCRIVEAELRKSSGDGTTYEATGRYVYRWEGREYESERISLVGSGDNVSDYHKRVHRQMERARQERDGEAHCYVNPRNPKKSVLVRELRPEQMAFLSIFCLLFPLVGAGIMYGGLWSRQNQKTQNTLRTMYPDEPWKWKAGWNDSPIPECGWSAGVALFPVAVWWALVTVPLLLAWFVNGVFVLPDGWWMLIPGVFFVLAAWIGLHRVKERARIGNVALDVVLPLRSGREITGAWITGKSLRSHDMPMLKIICKKSVTTQSGGESNTQTETAWEQEESLSVIDQTRDITTFRLPFRFRLPVDVEETTFDESSTKYEWKLEFRVPGTPVKSEFEVPVCRDPNEPVHEQLVEATESKAVDVEGRLPELLDKAKIQAVFDGSGKLTSLVCGPRRWLASIISMLVFNLIWTGIAVFLWKSDAPLIFKIVWPVTAAGMWLIIFYQMVSRCELRLESGEVHVTRKILIYQSHVVIPAAAIVSVSHGTNSSVNSTHYYWVKLITAEGKNITVASGIAGEPAALGLVRHLEKWRKSRVGG